MTKVVMSESEKTLLLYKALTTAKAAMADEPVPVRERSSDERREYMREAQRKSRARQRGVTSDDGVLPTETTIRDVLADAALMVLATEGPGATQVRAALGLAFPGRSGVAFTVGQRAQSGLMKPKVLTTEALVAARAAVKAEVADPAPLCSKKGSQTAEEMGFRRPSFLR